MLSIGVIMEMAFNSNFFDPIEYVRKMRNVGMPQEIAETQAQELEHIVQVAVSKSRDEFDKRSLETLNDLKISEEKLSREIREIDLKIEKLRYDSLKFTIWTGVAVVFTLGGTLGGMLARGFHWF